MKPVEEAIEQMKGGLKAVFKQFPLGFHDLAKPAAIASLAAHRQGKFWEYHNLLFENQKALKKADWVKWAGSLGLDTAQFEKDFSDPALEEQVTKDMLEGKRAGVRSTPSIFLNGRRVNASMFETDAIVNLVNREIFGR